MDLPYRLFHSFGCTQRHMCTRVHRYCSCIIDHKSPILHTRFDLKQISRFKLLNLIYLIVQNGQKFCDISFNLPIQDFPSLATFFPLGHVQTPPSRELLQSCSQLSEVHNVVAVIKQEEIVTMYH